MNYTYGDAAHKHAVTGLSDGSIFGYDLNGNMNTRQVGGQTFALTHDEENRLETVAGAATASFVYNGDGQRVLSTQGGVTTVFIGNYYEWTGSTTTAVKYYYAGSTRVAMRTGSNEPLFLLGDHLGSTNKIVHENGMLATPGAQRLYKAVGVHFVNSKKQRLARKESRQVKLPNMGEQLAVMPIQAKCISSPPGLNQAGHRLRLTLSRREHKNRTIQTGHRARDA